MFRARNLDTPKFDFIIYAQFIPQFFLLLVQGGITITISGSVNSMHWKHFSIDFHFMFNRKNIIYKYNTILELYLGIGKRLDYCTISN